MISKDENVNDNYSDINILNRNDIWSKADKPSGRVRQGSAIECASDCDLLGVGWMVPGVLSLVFYSQEKCSMFHYEPETQGCPPAVIVRLNSLKNFPYFKCLDNNYHHMVTIHITKSQIGETQKPKPSEPYRNTMLWK